MWPCALPAIDRPTKILYSPGFSSHCLLLLWLKPLTFIPKANQHIYEHVYNIVTKIGWNSPHCLLRYGVHKVFGSLPAVTFTYDVLTPKANQHIYEPKYISDQNWVKFHSLVLAAWRNYATSILGVVILSVRPSVRLSVRHTPAFW